MSDSSDLGLSYAGVFVHDSNLAVVLAVVDELVDKNEDHTLVYYRYGDAWYLHKSDIPITSVCFSTEPGLEIVLLGAEGTVIRLTQGGQVDETIDSSDEGPSELVIMRSISVVEKDLYAVGMARHAYCKPLNAAAWSAIDQSCFVPRANRTQAIGFYAISAFSATDIYAVGYKGEIWHFDGATWFQESSPTSVVLTSVVCDPTTRRVFVAGLAGMILKGHAGQWEVVHQEETRGDFWNATGFLDAVFFANDDGLFRLQDNLLQRVDLPTNGGNSSTSFVHAAAEVIWSVGRHDIFCSVDGVIWDRVANP